MLEGLEARKKLSTSIYGCLPRSLFLSCVTSWVVCLVLSLSFRPWLESPRLIRPLVLESLPDPSGDLPSWLAVGLDASPASFSSISDNRIWKSLSATCPGYCHDFTLLWNPVVWSGLPNLELGIGNLSMPEFSGIHSPNCTPSTMQSTKQSRAVHRHSQQLSWEWGVCPWHSVSRIFNRTLTFQRTPSMVVSFSKFWTSVSS